MGCRVFRGGCQALPQPFSDIAPAMLHPPGIEQPFEMTEKNLIIC